MAIADYQRRERHKTKEEKHSAQTRAVQLEKTFTLYIRFVLERTTRFLEAALEVHKRLAAEKSSKEAKEKEGGDKKEGDATTSTTTQQQQVDERLLQVLSESSLMHIFRPLSLVLCLMFKQEHYYSIISETLPHLTKLLSLIDTINGNSGDALAAEMDYLEKEQDKLQLKFVDRKKVETPHNYYPNTDEEKIVRIPGATHLCLTFDERCSTVRCYSNEHLNLI